MAATVSFRYDGEFDNADLVYRAGLGEANHVAVSFTSRRFTVTDTGATLVPGRGCEAVTPNEVRCGTGTDPIEFLEVDIETGDRDDVAAAPPCTTPLEYCDAMVTGGAGNDSVAGPGSGGGYTYTRLFGGPGRDVLRGGSGYHQVFGGAGNDMLLGGPDEDSMNGGPGADSFRGGSGGDWVSYDEKSRPVSVDPDGFADDGTRGEHDNVARDIEGIIGSRRSDRLAGSARDNPLAGRGGDDVLIGRRGDDWLMGEEGDDVLMGGPGADAFDLGRESDFFHAGRDTLLGGSGNDEFVARDRLRDVIRGGAGTDSAWLDRRLDSWRGIEELIGDDLTG